MFDLTLWQIGLIELLLGAIAVSFGYLLRPNVYVHRFERLFARSASKSVRSFLGLVLASLALRIALLPIEPVPAPLYHDEFSYLLGADTFSHGRLTNPTPPVAVAFETIHENLTPTYQSMYIPGTSLVLAGGRLLGSAWIGVWLITALLCGAVYWMVAGWLSRPYALVAGLITIAVTGTMNWWWDNYFCIALTSLGTALVLGALPRIAKTLQARWACLMGVGLGLLILTRPYEGACVTLPCALGLLWKLRHTAMKRVASLSALVCVAPTVAFTWLLYYNWRGTGRPLLFPYMVNLVRYHITGPFIFSAKHHLPVYDLDILKRFYIFAELPQFQFVHDHPFLFLAKKIVVYHTAASFGFGLPLIAGLIYLIGNRRINLFLLPMLGFSGLAVNVVVMGWSPFPQYIGPAFPLLILLIAFGFYRIRQINLARLTGTQLMHGLALAEAMFVLSLFGYRVSDSRNPPEPQYISKDRAWVASVVTHNGGKQLCLVRYTPTHASWQEWVFNGADLDSEQVLWARSLDPQTDQALMIAFPHRNVWLVKPDVPNDLVLPYIPNARDATPSAIAGRRN